jgi:hypothetical protein
MRMHMRTTAVVLRWFTIIFIRRIESASNLTFLPCVA